MMQDYHCVCHDVEGPWIGQALLVTCSVASYPNKEGDKKEDLARAMAV